MSAPLAHRIAAILAVTAIAWRTPPQPQGARA